MSNILLNYLQNAQIINDNDPLHIPGTIQPHGLLLVLEDTNLTIISISNNTLEILGISPEQCLGKSLDQLIDSEQFSLIKTALNQGLESINPLNIQIKTEKSHFYFDGIIHHHDGVIILELEQILTEKEHNFFSFYHLINTPINKIKSATNLGDLCQKIAEQIKDLTEFDRVMIYKFDEEGAGEVIAEAKAENLKPLLGLHYPSIDIPPPARRLFANNYIRFIPNVNYQPVSLIPPHNPLTKKPLDMTYSILRTVSPCHIKYLQNMGVSGSMVISLVRNQKLWGLISCHHYSPKYVTYQIRTACEILAQVMSSEIWSKEDSENLDYQIKLQSIQAKFVESISQSDDFVQGLLMQQDQLLELVNATGCAIYHNEQLICIGKTPEIPEIKNLVIWLENHFENNVFVTNSLTKFNPQSATYKHLASGLLALCISPLPKNYILWFRPEVIQTVNWAGDPDSSIEFESDGTLKLTPRNSFELWQETVKLKSSPWQSYEIQMTLELRTAIVGIVLKKSTELTQINHQLTLALDARQMVIWDWDLITNKIIWSKNYAPLLKLQPDRFVFTYQDFINYIYVEDRETVTEELAKAKREKKDYHQEFRVIWSNDHLHWIECKGRFFYDENQIPIRMLATVVEISDRKKTEAELITAKAELELRVIARTIELKESESKFRLLTEFSPVGVFLMSKDGQCTYTNPRCQQIAGYTLEESLGDGWTNYIHPQDLTDVLNKFKAHLLAEKFETYPEIRYLHKDGSITYARVQIAPILDSNNHITAYVGTIEDITESHALEQMKKEFISIVSHELRTPLTSIRGSLGLLASGILKKQPEVTQQMLEIAAGDTERLVRLVNDILDLDRLENQKVKLNKQWCDGLSLLEKSVNTIQSLAQENNINMEIIPDFVRVWGDSDRIIQTIVNLLSNGIKFSASNTTITLKVETLAEKVLFTIKDQGRGIPSDKLETIFGRFQQIDASDSRQKGGTGLGLAICRHIIQQHGGKIWVESELNQGSTFYFTLPIP